MAAEPVTFGAFVPGAHHIELRSGSYLDLADPNPADITLRDVAHGLANTCRFAGQCRTFYSVAEHAVLVADKLRADGAPAPVVLAGLHHDDPEAFIGDVTRPLKALLSGYRKLEDRVMAAIEAALGLPSHCHLAPGLKAADDWALAVEAHHLLPSHGATWFCTGLYEPAVNYGLSVDDRPLGMDPEEARDMWLRWHDHWAAATASEEKLP